MKTLFSKQKLISLFALALLILAALPVMAQDTPVTPVDQSPIYYVIVVLLAVLLVAALMFGAYITQWLAKLVPPETAASIYQSGVRFGLQFALDQAAQTASPIDDEFFVDLATQRGYQVEKLTNGHYQIKVPVPSTATASVPSDSTLDWKKRPPNREA